MSWPMGRCPLSGPACVRAGRDAQSGAAADGLIPADIAWLLIEFTDRCGTNGLPRMATS